MKRFLIALVACAPFAFAQTQTFTYTYGGLSIPVYPDDWNSVAVARILVSKSLAITKVTVAVQVQFSGVGDLNVYMWSPFGTRTKLLERNCGSLTNIDTTFDDSASSKYTDFCPQEAGRGPFRGNEPLSNFNDQNAYGYWRLGVENNGSSRTGLLTGFSVTITGTVLTPPVIGPNTIVSTASFKTGPIAPGDQVSIFGVNLGPVTGVRADPGATLPTTLAQTSVTFDGTPAPLFYASNNVVAVQAPTGLSPGTTPSIRVTATSGTSTSVTIPIVPSKPGIYTVEAGGGGQAKAINQDGTQNGDGSITGSDRAAPRGSFISVYATGLGALDPAVPQGSVAPSSPLSYVTLPVTATVGGVPATVTFAGAAPGQIGVYQVNLIVPLGASSGSVPLVFTAGGNSSQDDVTIQIR